MQRPINCLVLSLALFLSTALLAETARIQIQKILLSNNGDWNGHPVDFLRFYKNNKLNIVFSGGIPGYGYDGTYSIVSKDQIKVKIKPTEVHGRQDLEVEYRLFSCKLQTIYHLSYSYKLLCSNRINFLGMPHRDQKRKIQGYDVVSLGLEQTSINKPMYLREKPEKAGKIIKCSLQLKPDKVPEETDKLTGGMHVTLLGQLVNRSSKKASLKNWYYVEVIPEWPGEHCKKERGWLYTSF